MNSEALAKQLYALYVEAIGLKAVKWDWDHLSSVQKEAWIQVAQFVDARALEVETIPDHR